ncbi:RDD family protein [Corynebacterium heidelbergense]|uniref:RDD domain-containing protein n=1 Tax=Corynebacterium heidelbergense TaxID=2055947 RepID=A0A364VD79_9CORY|nr:RDD family protein [Corynebacterium heidelbergense]RAV34558.1 hypothetical protein CWC39_02540 [Corynebacterium heidelbergense]
MANKRSWLEGPELPAENEDPTNPSAYPGEGLGLPRTGPGSLATLTPRMGALLIDWLVCFGMAMMVTAATDAFGDNATVTLVLFILWRLFSVWLFAQSPGHSVMGIGVARIDDPTQRVGFIRSLARVLLVVFLLPPIIQDRDGRGMHDRATNTAVIRTRG